MRIHGAILSYLRRALEAAFALEGHHLTRSGVTMFRTEQQKTFAISVAVPGVQSTVRSALPFSTVPQMLAVSDRVISGRILPNDCSNTEAVLLRVRPDSQI
jgi:hypothetical protein